MPSSLRIEALLKVTGAGDALAALARRTGDPVRDVPPNVFEGVRAALSNDRQVAILEGEEAADDRAMGRIFGESLPSGLRLVGGEGEESET